MDKQALTIEAKQFLRTTQNGILSTFSAKFTGYPFGSVAPFVLDHDGSLIILISTIAEHTKNIIEHPKVSVVILAGEEDLQANARLTLLGEATLADKNNIFLRERYLRYHPQAEGYFDMHDFHFYRIRISHARYIAGFGKMGWLEGNALNSPTGDAPSPLMSQESDIINHMNEDHEHSMLAYCKHFHGLVGTHARMLGIDPDGFDVALTIEDQQQIVRFHADSPIHDANDARKMMVKMSQVSIVKSS